jgi:hypothetical protein
MLRRTAQATRGHLQFEPCAGCHRSDTTPTGRFRVLQLNVGVTRLRRSAPAWMWRGTGTTRSRRTPTRSAARPRRRRLRRRPRRSWTSLGLLDKLGKLGEHAGVNVSCGVQSSISRVRQFTAGFPIES